MSELLRLASLVAGMTAFSQAVPAADKPVDRLWGPIIYEDVQVGATGIAGVQSIAFDNFGIASDSGDNDLVERKMVSMTLPLELEPSQTARGFNADLRGFVARTEGARATLVFLLGDASAVVQYPPLASRDDPAASEDILVSLSSDETLAAGASVPLTILVIAQKPTPDGSVLFSVDSVDMALGVE